MGHINIKLADLIFEKGKSKNKVCYHCEVQRTQLNNYCNNKVSRVDLALMARVCEYLDCDISAILEYVSDEEDLNAEETKASEAAEEKKKDYPLKRTAGPSISFSVLPLSIIFPVHRSWPGACHRTRPDASFPLRSNPAEARGKCRSC